MYLNGLYWSSRIIFVIFASKIFGIKRDVVFPSPEPPRIRICIFGNAFAFTVIFLLRQVTGSSPFPYSLLAVFGTSAHSATPCSASG